MGRERNTAKIMERRSFLQDIELRADEETREISGYVALFDSPSVFMGFYETIERGAFTKTLQENPSIKALANHDTNRILGNTASGTLKLTEDDKGLFARINPPDTTWANDLIISIKRGDVPGSSFGFKPVKDQDTKDDKGILHRKLIEVILREVSVGVVFPAYLEAEQIQARHIEAFESNGIRFSELALVLERSKSDGYNINRNDEQIIQDAISILGELINRNEPVPPKVDHSVKEDSAEQFLRSFRQRLENTLGNENDHQGPTRKT